MPINDEAMRAYEAALVIIDAPDPAFGTDDLYEVISTGRVVIASLQAALDAALAREQAAVDALQTIADMYDTVTSEEGYVDEWVEAEGFNRCLDVAKEALLAATAQTETGDA